MKGGDDLAFVVRDRVLSLDPKACAPFWGNEQSLWSSAEARKVMCIFWAGSKCWSGALSGLLCLTMLVIGRPATKSTDQLLRESFHACL